MIYSEPLSRSISYHSLKVGLHFIDCCLQAFDLRPSTVLSHLLSLFLFCCCSVILSHSPIFLHSFSFPSLISPSPIPSFFYFSLTVGNAKCIALLVTSQGVHVDQCWEIVRAPHMDGNKRTGVWWTMAYICTDSRLCSETVQAASSLKICTSVKPKQISIHLNKMVLAGQH